MCGTFFFWLRENYSELLGFIFGVTYIIFSIRKSIWLWPIGLISSAAYIAVFAKSTLYADMLLQVYYLLVSVYGWYFWLKGKTNNKSKVKIEIASIKLFQWLFVISSIIILTFCLYLPFKQYTNASNPLWDGFVTAGSVVATFMLARKLIEQWLIWIVVDFASSALFYNKKLYLTVVLFIIYTVLAFIGYFKWKKDLLTQKV
jgi:nicotinamide mononucleotide transporter